MKAMIFAAGLGTRLRPLTDTLPKALLPIAGKTLLQWQVENLKSAGIRDIVINVHHFADRIIEYIQKNNDFGCRIAISDERDRLLETGGGLYHAKDLLLGTSRSGDNSEEPILVCNVDILSNIDLADLMASYRSEQLGQLVVSERTTQRYLLFDSDLRLRGWTNTSTGEYRPGMIEAPASLRPLAFSGMQILSPRIFEYMEEVAAARGPRFSLIDLYIDLCSTQTLSAYIPHNYRMMDVGKINQLADAEAFAQQLAFE